MIVVVRHGETALNAARVLQPADEPLNTRGLRQAELVATRIAALGASAILCSDLPRARMTAAAIARATSVQPELEPLLQERNFGALRGRPYEEIGRALFGPDFEPPEGESVARFDQRVLRAWEAVLQRMARTRGNLIVVTHGMVCASLARQVMHLGEQPSPGRWGNTSVTVCEPSPPHRVHTLNCIEHLRGVDDAREGGAPSGL